MTGNKHLTRREYLQKTAVLALGTGVSGCDMSSPKTTPANGRRQASSESSAYDNGSVPISQSGWATPPNEFADYPMLEGDIDADIAIVGAGLAGASLALHLTEAGVKVAVLEAHQPGWGASGRNAGHVLPTLKDINLINGFADGGRRFLEAFREHHTIPFDLSEKYGISCDSAQLGYLNMCSGVDSYEEQKKAAAFWKEQQGQQIAFLDTADMQRFTGSSYYPYGVLYESGGRINPYQFTNGMIAAAVDQGALVFGNSEALSINKNNKRWQVSSENGSVTAAQVVFCTNAYPGSIAPSLGNNFYPLTAYALSTQPLSKEALEVINPGRATLSQAPVSLNPFIIDEHNRIIMSSIPRASSPEDSERHFQDNLAWIHRTWPESKALNIKLEHYWTGRVALRDREFPGVFGLDKGVYGLMHFNAWGNVMAPLMGKLLAQGLQADRMDQLPFPLEKPTPVAMPAKQDILIRKLLIPAARIGQKFNIL
jgi:glycine/D-amino acid oxidase-like deaminating enzyme